MNLYHVHQLLHFNYTAGSPRPPSSPFQQLVPYVQHGLHITEHRLRSKAMTLGQEVLKHLRALSAEAKDLELDESSAFHIPSGEGGTKSSRYLRSLTWGNFSSVTSHFMALFHGFAVTDLNPQYFRVSRQCGGQQPDVCDLKASWVESQLLR